MIIIGLSVSVSYNQSDFTLTLNCTSTGLPPTNVTWSKDGVEISSGDSYTFSQRVIDMDNTVYENLLFVNNYLTSDVIQGLYQCVVQCYDDYNSLVNSASETLSVIGKMSK